MSSIEVQLARGPLQRRGKLAITNAGVEIHYPKWRQPWVLPLSHVIVVDPDVPVESQDDRMPAVFPRVELVRIHEERAPNFFLVPRGPVRVPQTEDVWCDVIALVVKEWPSEEQLSSTRLARQPSVNDALVAVYGTVEAPRLAPNEMQTGWEVEGQGLTRRGDYSRDSRPVARVTPAAGALVGGRRPTRSAAWWLAGVASALLGAAAWATAMDVDSDHIGEAIFLLAFLVGFAIRWTRTRTTTAGSRTAGAAAAGLTFLALSVGMVGASVRQLATEDGISVTQAAREFGERVGWDQLVRTWYATPLDPLIVALALFAAYGLGASGSDGRARRSKG